MNHDIYIYETLINLSNTIQSLHVFSAFHWISNKEKIALVLVSLIKMNASVSGWSSYWFRTWIAPSFFSLTRHFRGILGDSKYPEWCFGNLKHVGYLKARFCVFHALSLELKQCLTHVLNSFLLSWIGNLMLGKERCLWSQTDLGWEPGSATGGDQGHVTSLPGASVCKAPSD